MMRRWRIAALALGSCVVCAAPLYAGWFSRTKPSQESEANPQSTDGTRTRGALPSTTTHVSPTSAVEAPSKVAIGVVRERLLRMPDRGAEQAFLLTVQQKKTIAEDLRVLERLRKEKSEELDQYDRWFEEHYGMDPQATYAYDTDTKTIYHLAEEAKPEHPDASEAGEVERQVLRRIPDEESNKIFVRTLAAKQLTRHAAGTLELLLREKQMERDEVVKRLRERFAVDPDLDYQYDKTSMTLYQVVPASSAATMVSGPE